MQSGRWKILANFWKNILIGFWFMIIFQKGGHLSLLYPTSYYEPLIDFVFIFLHIVLRVNCIKHIGLHDNGKLLLTRSFSKTNRAALSINKLENIANVAYAFSDSITVNTCITNNCFAYASCLQSDSRNSFA